MDRIRQVSSTVLGIREEHRLRVRLPLASLTIAGHDAHELAPYLDLLRDEVNVKDVRLSDDLEALGHFDLRLDARVLGPRVGKDMKALLSAARAGEWETKGDGPVVAGRTLAEDEYRLALRAREGLEGLAVQGLTTNDMVVALDVRTSPELEREGYVRDLIRLTQVHRRESGLDVSDRIRLWVVEAPDDVRAGVGEHEDLIKRQLLADEVHLGAPPAGAEESAYEDSHPLGSIRVALARV
jgi:isoleucyl-tRNA synthetase